MLAQGQRNERTIRVIQRKQHTLGLSLVIRVTPARFHIKREVTNQRGVLSDDNYIIDCLSDRVDHGVSGR